MATVPTPNRSAGHGNYYSFLCGIAGHLKEHPSVVRADVGEVDSRVVIQLVQRRNVPNSLMPSAGEINVQGLMEQVAEKLNGVGWEIHDNGRYQVERTGEWYSCKQLAWIFNDESLPALAEPAS